MPVMLMVMLIVIVTVRDMLGFKKTVFSVSSFLFGWFLSY